MAKLSARGAHKIGQVTAEKNGVRYVFALRSDGKVLVRTAGYDVDGKYVAHPGGYSIFGKLKGDTFTSEHVAKLRDRLAKTMTIL